MFAGPLALDPSMTEVLASGGHWFTSPADLDHYRFAHGILTLDCTDPSFRARFRYLFSECLIAAEDVAVPVTVRCRVAGNDDWCLVELEHAHSLDLGSFLVAHGREAGLVESASKAPQAWRFFAAASDPALPRVAVHGNRVLFHRSFSWQSVVAQIAIHDVLRQQAEVLFFHAATLAADQGGIFLGGDKGSGKTTLALALAARGCGFLGDEYAAIEAESRSMLAMRRAVSLRSGPKPARLEAALAGREWVTDRAPDGTARIRISVQELFPEAGARSSSLTHAFFLRGFASMPRLVPFSPGEEEVPLLRPLLSTLWDQPPGKRVVQFLQLLAGVRCFHLEAGGSPDETAALILQTVEAS